MMQLRKSENESEFQVAITRVLTNVHTDGFRSGRGVEFVRVRSV